MMGDWRLLAGLAALILLATVVLFGAKTQRDDPALVELGELACLAAPTYELVLRAKDSPEGVRYEVAHLARAARWSELSWRFFEPLPGAQPWTSRANVPVFGQSSEVVEDGDGLVEVGEAIATARHQVLRVQVSGAVQGGTPVLVGEAALEDGNVTMRARNPAPVAVRFEPHELHLVVHHLIGPHTARAMLATMANIDRFADAPQETVGPGEASPIGMSVPFPFRTQEGASSPPGTYVFAFGSIDARLCGVVFLDLP